MDPKLRKVVQEAKRRREGRAKINFDALLFGPQKDFVKDPSRLKLACCSRRAGKSYGISIALLEVAMSAPRLNCLYVTLSRSNAKRILWPALQDINDACDLGLRFNNATGDVTCPNDSHILVMGAGSRREIEKARGSAYPAIVIDEAQVFGSDLNYMIDEVLRPATLDFDGWIALTGTPNAACAGPFFEAATGDHSGWSKHSWTFIENPHLPEGKEAWLEAELQRKGLTRQDAGYLREYEGKWVRDTTSLVFPYLEDVNAVDTFPKDLADDWDYVIGVDVGYNDPCAFTVLANSSTLGVCYAVESFKEEELTPTKAAVIVLQLQEKYPTGLVVVDSGGMGKGYIEEWKDSCGIHAIPATKRDKLAHIDFLKGDMRAGKLLFCKEACQSLIEEVKLLQWDANKIPYGIYTYDNNFPDHEADAMLYAYRQCRHHEVSLDPKLPLVGTEEYYRAKQEEWLQEAIKKSMQPETPFWKKLMRPPF